MKIRTVIATVEIESDVSLSELKRLIYESLSASEGQVLEVKQAHLQVAQPHKGL